VIHSDIFSQAFGMALAAALLMVGGCSGSAASPGALPTTMLRLGNKTFVLEIAASSESRERGLMRRDSMAADHGMIFVFPSEQPLAFWMRNTRIPLDIVYINQAGKVVSIKQMKPYDTTEVRSDAPAKWAIELNQGAARDAGVKVGDVLEIPPPAQHAQ
jgi:uncharacterized membrane protein (UPF0127 family)